MGLIMLLEEQLIADVFNFIVEHGVLTNQAKSAWGADTWELGLLKARLCDDGATQGVQSSRTGLYVSNTCGRILYFRGNIEQLKELRDSLYE
jgi:hypothetical protein